MDKSPANEFLRQIERNATELRKYVKRDAPRIVGTIAVNHIREDFAAGGFTDGGRTPWKVTKRQLSGGTGAASQYGPLTSGRNRLMHSIIYSTGDARVTIKTDVPYAAIHNFGGTVRPRVTKRMRRFAWAMYYELSGIPKKGKDGKKRKRYTLPKPEAEMWKRMALTRKQTLVINIPQRRFMPDGDTPELRKKIAARIEKDLMKILNQ